MPATAPSQPYGFPVVAARDLDDESDDDRGDHHEAGGADAWTSIIRKRSSRPSPRRPRIVSLRPPSRISVPNAVRIPSETRPEPGLPPTHCAASITSPSATATSGRNHFVLVICIEHLLDRYVEVAGERERELERRDVAPRLDRVDRLSRHAERLRKLALREKCVQPPFAYTVFHLLM